MNYKYKLKMISVENIYYKNKAVKKSYEEKINMICQLFQEEKIRSKKVMIGFPIMQTTVSQIDDYKVQYCQFYNEGIVKIPYKVFEVKEQNNNMVFTTTFHLKSYIYKNNIKKTTFKKITFKKQRGFCSYMSLYVFTTLKKHIFLNVYGF
jgi:hypothetical protein